MRKNIDLSAKEYIEIIDSFYNYFEDGYKFEEFLKVYLEKIGLEEVFVTKKSGWADAMGGYYHHIHREVDIETVGQFTGFYDKEGAKIFEGDIITDDMNREWVSAVFFRFGEFKVNPHPAGTYLWELDADDRIVFLGNIYDHPELLEV